MSIWKSDLPDKMKRKFFQVVAVSVLLHDGTAGTLKKRMETNTPWWCTVGNFNYFLNMSDTKVTIFFSNTSYLLYLTHEDYWTNLKHICQRMISWKSSEMISVFLRKRNFSCSLEHNMMKQKMDKELNEKKKKKEKKRRYN